MEAGVEVKIPFEMERKIEEISKEMGIAKEEIIIEALREFLEEYKDYEEAYRRYKNPDDRLITAKELRDSLGL